MNKYCPSCGAEVAAGAAFCGNCGKPVSPEKSQQSQPASSGNSAQTIAPPQKSVVAPQVSPQAPPTGGGKSRKGLILGGLAAAGVLGFIALIVVGAAIYFFAFAPDEPVPKPEPAPQPTPQPIEGEDQPVEPAPESGSLDSLVQDQVGDFTLQQVDTIPEAVDAGSIDARWMLYASPDGVEVSHDVSVWSSPEAADEMLLGFADGLVSEGAQPVEEFEVTGQEGEVLGAGVFLVDPDGIETILWTNGDIFCVIYAPEGYGVDFFGSLPY